MCSGGGGYKVKGEKKAFNERHSGRKIIKEHLGSF